MKFEVEMRQSKDITLHVEANSKEEAQVIALASYVDNWTCKSSVIKEISLLPIVFWARSIGG